MKVLKNSIIGICAGFITGFFSTGGGMLILPAFIYFMKMDEKRARATTIFTVLPMVITASFLYFNDQGYETGLGIKCAIGGIIGGILGTKLMKIISNKFLKIVFILFLIYASYVVIR